MHDGEPKLQSAQGSDDLAISYLSSGDVKVVLKINGRSQALNIEPRVTLLDALREKLGLIGSKKESDHGQCGTCTVQQF